MTDVLKNFVEVDSSKIESAVKKRPDLFEKSAEILREELRDLGVSQPEIIVFGGKAEKYARQMLSPADYSRIVKVTHYSHFIGPDKYRRVVLAQCE